MANIYDWTVNAVTTETTLTVADSGKTYTNEGTSTKIIFNLPPAVANLMYTFIVQDSDGLRIIANTGDTIRIGSTVSKLAGYVENLTIGNMIKLVAINATEWIAEYQIGTWTIEIS